MKYIKKLIRNSKRALNQQVIKNKQEIVKYAPRLTGIQVLKERAFSHNLFSSIDKAQTRKPDNCSSRRKQKSPGFNPSLLSFAHSKGRLRATDSH